MGKLKELIQEYLRAPMGSPSEAEIASEIMKISDWMIAQGISDKPVTLPNKRSGKYKYLESFLFDCGNGFLVSNFSIKNNWDDVLKTMALDTGRITTNEVYKEKERQEKNG